MVSRSYSNLSDLAAGDLPSPSFTRMTCQIPRIMTVAGIVSDDPSESVCSELSSPSIQHDRLIIVANQLPIRARRKTNGSKGWDFSLDENSLLLQLKDGLGLEKDEIDVIFVGCLKEEIHPNEQDEVSQTLLEKFKCVPTFFPPGLYTRFYHGFCKQQLWPLFHYMLPLSPDLGGRFNRSLWQAYVSVNKIFADRIMEVISPEDDFVWIHDYHLMVLPTFLRKRFNRVKLGFFLHSPFPSSEIYKTLPVREEILRALLNSDLIGFHTFDYARHFLSCCSRMLGISYESKRGYISLEYYGRTVTIKILPVGIHMRRLQSVLNLPETESKVSELIKQFKNQGKTMLLGVDDMDIFKGISLKLLAMEQLLIQHPECQGKIVLVQIANPARGNGNDVKEVKAETYSTVKRINDSFGKPGYQPIILVDEPLKFYERVAYYVVAECCLVTAVRDGMNLIPYEYIISRQGNDKLDKVLGLEPCMSKKSMLVVSEFIGCSPSLSGAIRVNPWDIDSVADAMDCALELSEPEKQMRHEKHYRYVSTHDVGYWARSFLQDLKRTCKDHVRKRLKGDEEWETCVQVDDSGWKQNAHPVMTLYTETTDGSMIEMKDASMAWCYEDADPDFGSCQAKELLDHLESVLSNEPVTVKRGQSCVEIKPQGVSKGLVVKRMLATMQQRGMTPDFVLCIGDDRSDEDMFEVITTSAASDKCIAPNAEVFACTVGNKPSKAKYYLDDTVEIARMMQGLALVSQRSDNFF
ncbi:hypothetical protein E3N88_01892 [Mikania micrantha]|uniref:Uncharacterized protein n=1 Tax=Mikania micrantha TaxID=192012 RepID=A0A5N6Q3W3_9ASTR|nr:hypothetical protein E3N88_01892 [Mikania micrantha]